MLVRTNKTEGSVENITWKSDDSSSAQVPPVVFNVDWPLKIPSYETYFEQISPPVPGSRRNDWHSFDHYKIGCVSSPMRQRIKYATSRGASYPHSYAYALVEEPLFGYTHSAFGSAGKSNSQLPLFYSYVGDNDFVVTPSAVASLKARSLQTMLPLIKAELSSINSFIELRDFQTLPRTLRSIFSPSEFAFNFARTLGQTLRRLTRTGSDGYLQYKFNLAPLLSDICGIAAAAHRTLKRMNELVSRSGMTQSKHFRFDFIEYPNSEEYATEPGIVLPYHEITPLGTFTSRRRVNYDLTSFHAQIQYNYNYTRYQIEHAQLLSFLDGIGVNLNPAIIWNAIPWSFVVDWLVGVGRWLDNRKRLNMEPKINIHRYLWSAKQRRRIDVSYKYETPDNLFAGWSGTPGNSQALIGPFTRQVVQLPTVVETAYKRSVSLPSSSLLTTSGLNATEFSLGAALVLTKRSRPRTHQR